MIIDPDFRKCVTYLFIDKVDDETGETHRTPAATAFFVCVPMLNGAVQAVYIVTARHVIRESRAYGPLYARLNFIDGTHVDLIASQDMWIEHPTTDVALCPTLMPEKHDIKYIPTNIIATPEFITQNGIREGDDLFFCGLFQTLPGQEKMQPIIRFGNISLMPYEKIPLRDNPESEYYLSDAYLVEAKSWGGHSGSPAFLYLNPSRAPGQISFIPGRPNFVLLGLVSSHYEIPQNVKFMGDILGSGTVGINAGLAAVIPANFINELLLGSELTEQRKRLENYMKSSTPNPKELNDILKIVAHPVEKNK